MSARLTTRSGLVAAALLLAPAAGVAHVAPPPVVTLSSQAVPAGRDSGAERAEFRRAHAHGDPLEGLNRGLFSIHQALDRFLFRPAAIAYRTVIPKVIRTGVRHIFSNLGEPVVFVNDVLQLKPKRAAKTFERFAINSILGIGGVLDVAKGEKLPHRNNGFGNTLGRYGIGPGPYLFLPLIGPTDLRDLAGGQADAAVLPVAIGNPFDRIEYQAPHAVLTGLDLRAESDGDLKALLDGAADPYATLRSVFLQSRTAEVGELRHGKGGEANPLDDPLADPEAPAAVAGPKASPSDRNAGAPPLTDTPADPEPASPPPTPG
ncbi:MAG: VacJ family lipoprotein [Sphingomonadaceae bacterium]|nr:VacJ family lipoprotein [Sphingomonadaceae bacterium]